MRSHVVLLACVAFLWCQAEPPLTVDEEYIDPNIQTVGDFLDGVNIDQLYNRISDEGIKHGIIGPIGILKAFQATIDNYRDTTYCIGEVTENAPTQPIEDVRVIVSAVEALIRILMKRNDDVTACEANSSNSTMGLIRTHVCLARVESTTGVQIALYNVKIQQAATRLRDLQGDLNACVEYIIPELDMTTPEYYDGA